MAGEVDHRDVGTVRLVGEGAHRGAQLVRRQVPAQVDIGGFWLPRVSPYTLNYSLSQLIPTEFGNFDWIIQGQTRGRHFMTPYNGDGTSLAPRVLTRRWQRGSDPASMAVAG